MAKTPSLVRTQYGELAPDLVNYTEDILFGEVWKNPGLSPRDRSLVTIAALTAGGNVEQLSFHLNYGRQNGLTEEEIVQEITHLAFYCGWPKAMSAIQMAKKIFAEPVPKGS